MNTFDRRCYAERKFDRKFAEAMGLDKPESPTVWKQDRDWLNVIPFLPDMSQTSCFFSGHNILGCSRRPSKPIYIVYYRDLRGSGLPLTTCTEPIFYLPMCHNCSYLFFHVHFKYKCKVSWVTAVSGMEVKSPKTVRSWLVENVDRFKDITKEKRQEANSYHFQLLRNVETIELSTLGIWHSCPELDGKNITYIDARELKDRHRIIVKIWNKML